MKKTIVQTTALAIIIFLSVFSADAQLKKRLSDQNAGYSFLPPAGFETKQSDEGFALVDTAQTLILVVKAHNYSNFQQFAGEADLEKDGFTLIGKIQTLGEQNKVFRASKQTAQGALIADTFVTFSPYGGGVLIVALAEQKYAEKGFQKGLEITETITFSKPVPAPGNSRIESLFRGKHLLYFYTASGFSERTDIFLCRSGSFIYRINSSSLSANGSGALGANSDGKWKIFGDGANAELILQFNNGTTRRYSVSARQASNEINLNGKRFFVQDHSQCN